MNEKTKKILIYSGIGVGVIIAFYVTITIMTKIAQKRSDGKNGDGDGGLLNPNPEIQPTLSSEQANSIANQVYDQIDDANIISGIDDTLKILAPIQNSKDWDLVKLSYGVRIKVNPYFFDDYTGDLPGALNDEYKGSQSDMTKLRNFFATKGITSGI
jgi:hypothetical protein